MQVRAFERFIPLTCCVFQTEHFGTDFYGLDLSLYVLCRETSCYFFACEQQRRKSACASAQSDQRLGFSPSRFCHMHMFNIILVFSLL